MRQAQQGELLEERVNDATSKVSLLDGEVAFNESLAATLGEIQAIQKTLDLVLRAILAGQLLEAVDLLGQAEEAFEFTLLPRSTKAAGVLGAKIADLRSDVVEKLTDCWKAHIFVDAARSSLKISPNPNGGFLRYFP